MLTRRASLPGSPLSCCSRCRCRGVVGRAQGHEPAAPAGGPAAAAGGAQPVEHAEAEPRTAASTPSATRSRGCSTSRVLVGVLVYFLQDARSPATSAAAARRSARISSPPPRCGGRHGAARSDSAASSRRCRRNSRRLKTRAAKKTCARRRSASRRRPQTERERLLDQTRREIDMRLRMARRELTEHAAAARGVGRAGSHRAHHHPGRSVAARRSLLDAAAGGAMTSRAAAAALRARAVRRRARRAARTSIRSTAN